MDIHGRTNLYRAGAAVCCLAKYCEYIIASRVLEFCGQTLVVDQQ
jgi:hypothetical protein